MPGNDQHGRSEDRANGGSVSPVDGLGANGIDVFISYGHTDLAVARELRGFLEAGGYGCWMAPDDVTGPSAWADQLVAAIRDCRVMLVLISADSIGSDHVSKEVDLAVEYGKPLFPVRLEDIMPSGTLRYLLGLAQWMDAFPGPIESHSGEVLRRVTALLATTATDEPSLSTAAADLPHRRPLQRESAKRRVRPSLLAAAGFVAVGVSIGVVWFSGASTSSDTTTATTELAAPTTTTPAVEEPAGTVLEELWSLALDSPVVGMTTMDGLAVIATGDGLVRGVAVSSGEVLWTHQADLSAQHGVFASGGVIYYATSQGVSLLDPATGDPLEGCGFSFRGKAHGVAVNNGSVYFSLSADGTVRRVPSNPISEGPCHDLAIESAETAQWPPAQSGPVVIGSEVLTGDSRRLSRYDVASLDLIDSYYLAAGTDEGYDGRVVGLAGLERRTQHETGVRVQVAVYGLDAENNLYVMSGTGMVAAGLEVAVLPVVSSSAVYVAQTDRTLAAFSHDLSATYWTIDLPIEATGLWLDSETVYVAVDDGRVFGLSAEDGWEVHQLEPVEEIISVAVAENVVVVADGAGGAAAFATSDEIAMPEPALDPIQRPVPSDPEEVVQEFFTAMTLGERGRVTELVGVDAVFGTVFDGGTWFNRVNRDEFWGLVDFFNALNVRLEIGSCERTDVGTAVRIDCEVTQTDDFLTALGSHLQGSAVVTVESGLVRVLGSRINFNSPTNRDVALASSRRGLIFPDNSDLLYQEFFDWAVETIPEMLAAACGVDLVDQASAECAWLMTDRIEEYLAASD